MKTFEEDEEIIDKLIFAVGILADEFHYKQISAAEYFEKKDSLIKEALTKIKSYEQ